MTDAEIAAFLIARYPQTQNARTVLAMASIAVEPSKLFSYRIYPHYPVNSLLLYHSDELAIGWDDINDQITHLYSLADFLAFIEMTRARYRWVGEFLTIPEWLAKCKAQANTSKAQWSHGYGPPTPGPTQVRDVWTLLRNPS